MTASKKTAPPGRDRLLRDSFRYMEHTTLETFEAADWAVLNRQRGEYASEQLAEQVLRMLVVSRDDPTFGYQINNYHHCLQTATLMMGDGLDDETVVMGLLHDLGFTVCPDSHAEFAATILGPYLSDRNLWVLLQHAVFQQYHIHEYPGLEENARERFRGHPDFEAAATFVERYDIVAINPNVDTAPIEVFEPLVNRFFERPHPEALQRNGANS